VGYTDGMRSREIRLAARPVGWPTAETFAFAEVELREPAEGEIVVKNRFLSVDPYMRGRMNDAKSYVPPFKVGAALEGSAVGEVIASRAPGVAVGDVVLSMFGWREAFVAPAAMVRVVDRDVPRLSDYLGVLGLTGMTAWYGLRLVGLKAGDRVFVSGAAGAVGMIVGQLAKRLGCYVVGSAGSAEKVALLTGELGFDRAFDYKQGRLLEQLTEAAPEGIDVYFDNVGGDHLEAAISAMRPFGRIAVCGAIAQYNDEAPRPGPRNLMMIIGKRLMIRGFIVSDAVAETPTFLAEVAPLVRAGALKAPETCVDGLDAMPAAFLSLLRGGNTGKMVIALS
jgi:NADPH-dependent curcumin reductase CurA